MDLADDTITGWNFNIASLSYDGKTLLGGDDSSNVQVNLDPTTPFLTFDTSSYAKLINILQIEDGKYWKCQDTPVRTNDGSDTKDWWTSCFSTQSCFYYQALSPLEMGLPSADNTTSNYDASNVTSLWLTTYAFYQNASYYDAANTINTMSESNPSGIDAATLNASCQLMVSWSTDPTVTSTNVTFGLPFFRQYGVGLDMSSQQLYLKNQTIATLAYLDTPTAQDNAHGKFKGIVAFVIVLCALAGFGLIAWGIWFIHQKIHARDMNWESEESQLNTA